MSLTIYRDGIIWYDIYGDFFFLCYVFFLIGIPLITLAWLQVKWSGRLYMELRRAHIAKRGFDPQEKWFENQIGFLESYLLPAARRLEDTGVFGEDIGQMFAAIVEANRDKWLVQGYEEARRVIVAGAKKYPFKN